jgi:hypothetical protein
MKEVVVVRVGDLSSERSNGPWDSGGPTGMSSAMPRPARAWQRCSCADLDVMAKALIVSCDAGGEQATGAHTAGIDPNASE